MQTRRFGGFCYFRVSVSRPRADGAVRAADSARTASVHQDSTGSNRAGYALVRKAILHLDDIAGFIAFSELEQSKNWADSMVPLYAARVQDLGPDDVAVFKCGACGHTAELWPSLLTGGLGLKPTDKVLDLERRLRCRLCYARGQAVVSIKWKATS
jgi:hypothetical protein